MFNDKKHIVLILGGGFAGISTALNLARKHLNNLRIILISDRPHFEYHGALYRLVAGRSPLEVCIPLREIFKKYNVEVIEDTVKRMDIANNKVYGRQNQDYDFNTLVLGLGSETNYFNIPGLEEHSFGMKTINDALRLKNHIHDVITTCEITDKGEKLCNGNFVVIGGGATGTELAAELAIYTKELAAKHNLEPSLMNVELVEASPRLMGNLPNKFASKIEEKVRSVGVNIHFNRAVLKEEVAGVYLKDMELQASTVIWTAGVKANHLYNEGGLKCDKSGKVLVNQYLQAKGHNNIYVAGDSAITKYSGMAQTALLDGKSIANNIVNQIHKRNLKKATILKPIYAIPVGPGWAGVIIGPFKLYGKLGWFFRRLVDFIVFKTLLPWGKAITVYRSGEALSDSCEVCSKE